MGITTEEMSSINRGVLTGTASVRWSCHRNRLQQHSSLFQIDDYYRDTASPVVCSVAEGGGHGGSAVRVHDVGPA